MTLTLERGGALLMRHRPAPSRRNDAVEMLFILGALRHEVREVTDAHCRLTGKQADPNIAAAFAILEARIGQMLEGQRETPLNAHVRRDGA